MAEKQNKCKQFHFIMARHQIKAPVQLRRKKMKNGGESLYLDIYYDGIRKYEYLKIYLNPEHTTKDKQQNREMMQIAQEICNRRILEVQQNGLNIPTYEKLVDVIDKFVRNVKYQQIIRRIIEGVNVNAETIDVNKHFANNAFSYIDSMNVSVNSKHLYYAVFCCFIRKLIKKEMVKEFTIPTNDFRMKEARRMFMTLDEIKQFAEVETNDDVELEVKRLFMFCCMTGIRYVDAHQIRYRDFEEIKGRIRLNFRQQKTSGLEYYDLSDNVRRWIGDGEGNELVFKIGEKTYRTYECLQRLVERAGINKHITFHCARHSFAILMIELGVDIFTTSKLLGHRSVATTQIYAKVLDKKKQSAVDLIPEI